MANAVEVPRVLIVEDDDLLARILRLNLARRGYTVTDAYSVEGACEALEVAATLHRPFDLLLLDINLPDRTGWDLLRHMRAHGASASSIPHMSTRTHGEPSDLPRVIVMTAVRPPECRVREFRPVGVLVKPFPIDALLQLVGRIVHIPPDSVPAAGAYSETDDSDVGDADTMR